MRFGMRFGVNAQVPMVPRRPRPGSLRSASRLLRGAALTLLALLAPAQGLASQLIWELEPDPGQGAPRAAAGHPVPPLPPLPSPPRIASGLRWEADDEAVPLLAGGQHLQWSAAADGELPEAGESRALAAGPGLSPEDLEALLLEPYSPPNLGGGLPTAYVANWGDFYLLASAGFGGDRDVSDGDFDAAFSTGVGFGDDQQLVAVELRWNIASFKNFNSNGSFDVAVGRTLVNQPRLQVMVAGGILDAYAYRSSASSESIPDPTGFGVVTMALPLREPNFRFNQVLQISAGVGGRDFAALDSNLRGNDYSAFGAIGVELAPNVGISAGVSGRGSNVNLSYTPFRDVPIAVNLLAADVFDQSPFGTVGVLTVSWGDNFRRGLF